MTHSDDEDNDTIHAGLVDVATRTNADLQARCVELERLGQRMATAIESAINPINEMWEAFPYAEKPGDGEAMSELTFSANAWLKFILSITPTTEK